MTKPDTQEKKRGRPREFDRHQTLCTALTVFRKHGYENTTMRMLSDELGITSPSIYCAFGSKADLFIQALREYRRSYWDPLFNKYLEEEDIYRATLELFDGAARILLSPAAPCGCITVSSLICIPEKELKVREAIAELRAHTASVFRSRLLEAITAGQLPPDCDVPAISGALKNFFEGLAVQAMGNICQAELIQIARLAVRLLPAP